MSVRRWRECEVVARARKRLDEVYLTIAISIKLVVTLNVALERILLLTPELVRCLLFGMSGALLPVERPGIFDHQRHSLYSPERVSRPSVDLVPSSNDVAAHHCYCYHELDREQYRPDVRSSEVLGSE